MNEFSLFSYEPLCICGLVIIVKKLVSKNSMTKKKKRLQQVQPNQILPVNGCNHKQAVLNHLSGRSNHENFTMLYTNFSNHYLHGEV